VQVFDFPMDLDPRIRLFRGERKLGEKSPFWSGDEVCTSMFQRLSDDVVRLEHEDALQSSVNSYFLADTHASPSCHVNLPSHLRTE
jgi:hypothetical protein